MKKILTTVLLISFTTIAFCQKESDDSGEKKKFKKENLFTGGNLNIGYYGGITVLGATPEIGYSFTNWLDAGIAFEYTYMGQRTESVKYRRYFYGPGIFTRIFPVDFLFANIQFEHNFDKYKEIAVNGGYEVTDTRDANSLLLGLGYTTGREGKGSSYYYVSLSFEVLGDPYSPYRTKYNEAYPVVKAGFVIPLFQGGGSKR